MKSKIMMVCLLPLALTACFSFNERPVVTKTVYKVVEVEEKYYECDEIPLPDPDTLDDERIARLINDLVKANRVCGNNMKAIRIYQEAAKKLIEEKSE